MPWSSSNLPPNVKGMDLSAHQIDVFVKAANAALKEYGDDATAIKVGISAATQKENDLLPGGKSDNMTLEQIAEKHGVKIEELKKQFDKGIKVESEHTNDPAKAEEIAKDHLFEDAEYYTKLAKMEGEKQNDTGYTRPVKIKTISVKKGDEWAKTYVATGFIEKGVCTYKEERIYLSQETLQKAMPTMKGRPNVIQHQKVTPENMQELAVGYTSSEGIFNTETASFDVPFLIFDEEGKQKIADGWSVSCAYIPKAFGQGGTWHNTPYDREVTDLEFTHLALVPDPRYEDAKIYENSKDKNMDKKGKWITIRGTHVFIEEGQDVQEALDKQFNKKEIEFTGKNTKDLKELLGDNLRVSDNGKITVNTEKGNITILKEDKIKIDGNNIEIKKPSYVGGKPIIAKLKDNKSFDYVDDGEKIQIIKDDNNKYHIHYGVDKEGKPTSKASGFESLEEAEKTLKKHRPNYTEKQNSTDNTTKETYNMEKIEVEQGFLASLIAMAQKPFLNAKEEEKSKEDKDEDEMEYEGEKYSKKELVNCFKAKKNEAEKEKEDSEEDKKEKEEEKKNSITSEEMQYFNAVQAKIEAGQSQQQEIISTWTDSQGEKEGYDMFRMK